MSKLEVDKIDPQSGTNLELGTSGDTITIPAGVTFDSSAATNSLPSNVVTTDGSQTLTNKNIVASQLTGTVATSNLGTGTADSTTFLRGDQTYASATPAAGSITTTQLAYNPNPFRNIIINGDMSIDQRNGGSSVTATNGGYTVDRWLTGSSQSSKFTVDQETDAPTGFSYSVKLTSSASTTPASTDQYWFAQNIEGFNTAYLEYGNSNAKTVTVSFHVKSSLTGTFSGSLMNSSYNYSYPFTYSISSANTWEKKSVVITGATAGTWIGATNGVGIRMYFSLGNGSNFLGTAGSWSASQNNGATGETQLVGTSGATLFITGVQLEVGTTASDFEFLPVDVNLNRCLRYYNEINVTNNGSTFINGALDGNNGTAICAYTFPFVMRSAPTASYSGTFDIYVAGSLTQKTDLNIQSGTRGFRVLSNGVTGTSGQAVQIDIGSGDRVLLSSEL